jgi:Lipocalin-like domain
MASSPDVNAVLGTWRLQSYVREVLETGERYNQFGDDPDGYIGYSPDGRMYAIFTRKDRQTPADAVPTDEEALSCSELWWPMPERSRLKPKR